MQDPDTYVRALGLELYDLFEDNRPAVIDAERRTQVNYEIFYFASSGHKINFEKNLKLHCGVITDPVTHQRFRPGEDSPHLKHDNRDYFFVSDSTFAAFRERPAAYAFPDYRMPEMASDSIDMM